MECQQAALADRALLQVDQAALANQGVLRHLGERGEDPDLDRDLDLPHRGDLEERARARAESLHNFAGDQRVAVRENPASGRDIRTLRGGRERLKCRAFGQPVAVVQVTSGQ